MTASDVIWSGHWQAVRLGAPAEMVANLLREATEAEQAERRLPQRVTQPNDWNGEPLYGREQENR